MKLKLSSLIFILFLLSCNDHQYVQGEALYQAYCSSCHMSDGTGLKNVYPSIIYSATLKSRDFNLPCAIRYGHQKREVQIGAAMEGYLKLSDVEISNITNFIYYDFLKQKPMPFTKIKKDLESCVRDK